MCMCVRLMVSFIAVRMVPESSCLQAVRLCVVIPKVS